MCACFTIAVRGYLAAVAGAGVVIDCDECLFKYSLFVKRCKCAVECVCVCVAVVAF